MPQKETAPEMTMNKRQTKGDTNNLVAIFIRAKMDDMTISGNEIFLCRECG
jgi:hypothetical protein